MTQPAGHLLKAIGIALLVWATVSFGVASAEVADSDSDDVGVIVNAGTPTVTPTVEPTEEPTVVPTATPEPTVPATTVITSLPETGAEPGSDNPFLLAAALLVAGGAFLAAGTMANRRTS